MQTITARSIPLVALIEDLAHEMDAEILGNCDVKTLVLPAAFGEGTIEGVDFPNGMGIILYNCIFKNDIEIHFIKNETHPLKFLFCEMGNLIHRFENEAEEHFIDSLQSVIVSSCIENGHILRFKGGLHTKINSLEINREIFLRNMDCEVKSLESDLENLFRDVKAKNTFYYSGNYSLKMADLFMEMEDEDGKSFMKKILLESAAFRMLILEILQYKDDMAKPENMSMLRKFEINSVKQAAHIIDNEILNFKTIPELALKVGLNANKLQNGFRELYGNTVNGYISDRRLDLAASLLKNSDLTISEIVYMIGLSSKSYFSKIFKEKYGLSPSSARGNRNNGRNEKS